MPKLGDDSTPHSSLRGTSEALPSSEEEERSELSAESEHESEERSEDEIPCEDYQEVRDIPSPPHEETSLEVAIREAPASQLQSMILSLIAQIPAARVAVAQTFLAPTKTGGKRKRFETCENCGESYSIDTNYLGCCTYHEGEKEMKDDSDFWADHDWQCHGDPWSSELMNDPNYADGYQWSCCELDMDAEGCVISRHAPKRSYPLKRVRS